MEDCVTPIYQVEQVWITNESALGKNLESSFEMPWLDKEKWMLHQIKGVRLSFADCKIMLLVDCVAPVGQLRVIKKFLLEKFVDDKLSFEMSQLDKEKLDGRRL